ncbi:MAG: 4-hydroxy-tetrahydrodipicolinate synthase [Spirochaetales bacterium]|nr:4-hydroxy-tetrahydrodipicolinate synthase [Spirochaetales bacterium]
MFKGVFTAIITPFREDDTIDEEALRNLVEMQIVKGVHGLVPVGTTGESPTLSYEEHIKVIEIVTKQANGRVPVIAGTGANCTDEAVMLTRKAGEIGVTASLQVAPYYNKPTPQGFLKHFTTIADAIDLPMIVYNIPSRTGKNIDNETMLQLAKHRNIKGVKEASGDIGQVMNLIMRKPEEFCVLSGDDNLAYPIMALGGDGVVSVASNLIPDKMAELVNRMLKKDFEAALKMHYELLPLFKSLFIETNPIPVKTALSLMNLAKEKFRLPMCTMEAKNRETLVSVLKTYKII